MKGLVIKMFYVFENGRILQDPLKPEIHEKGLYIEAEVLPEIQPQVGMSCYLFADLNDGLIKIATEPYIPVEIPDDNNASEVVEEPPLSDVEQFQLTTTLQIEYLICLHEVNNI